MYSNVSLFAQNTEFHSEGPLAAPYPGQSTTLGATGYAAFDVHNMYLDLAGYSNKIHHKSNGVVAGNSDVRVENCSMRDIQPDAAYSALVGNGAGINCYGPQGWHTLKQLGFGAGATAPPSFKDCRWGIYTRQMSVYSQDNHMDNVGTAYRVEKSDNREVELTHNRATTQLHGIDLRFNDGALRVAVEHNDITFGSVQCDACKGYTGILVTEGNTPASDSRIMNNTIRFLPVAGSRIGIGLTAAADWLVAENTLLMASNAHNLTGISLNGCNRPEVSCNTITGASAVSFPLESQSAIRNVMGNDPLIGCNVVDLTTNGILFNGVAPNTDLRGNKLNRHRWGLHLDGTAIIDVQDRKGNLWHQPPPSNGLGAWYEVSDVQASAYQFLYNPATINGGSTQPPSWSPPNWFNITFGTNYDCDNHHGVEYCSQFKQRGKEGLTGLDVQVANDSLQNDPYTEESKLMLKSRLYKKLDEQPELADSLQAMADFYNEQQGSTTAALKAIDDERAHLNHLDSMVVEAVRMNRAQVDSLGALLNEALVDLLDSTLSAAQREAIRAGIAGLKEAIGALVNWSAAIAEAVSGAKAQAATVLQALTAGVATSEAIQANEKAVSGIYLAAIGTDAHAFTASEASTLLGIASQCPMLGGNAVFQARALYWLIDDAHDFDDASLCLPHGIIVKSVTPDRTSTVRIEPNPATDDAALIFSEPLPWDCALSVFNALGGGVIRILVPPETPRMAFDASRLAPGIYSYSVASGTRAIGHGKLTIAR